MAEKTPSILKTDFPITLGGKTYTLSFPLPSLFAFKALTGISLFERPELSDDPEERKEQLRQHEEKITGSTVEEKLERTIDFLYVGLLAHHPGITREQAGNMIFPHNMNYVDETVGEAMRATWSRPKDNEESEGGADPLSHPAPSN